MFFYLLKLVFFRFFFPPELTGFFSEIDNNPMRAMGRKNTFFVCFFGVMRRLDLMWVLIYNREKNILP